MRSKIATARESLPIPTDRNSLARNSGYLKSCYGHSCSYIGDP